MTPEELAALFSNPEALASTEAGERDEATTEPAPQLRTVWELREEFDAFINGLGLQHFRPEEFLVKGGSHNSGGCAGLNTNPPRGLWPNITNTALVLDHLRSNLGHGISLTSVYRSPAYNSCIAGAGASYHMQFNAADFQGTQGNPQIWAAELRSMRAAGVFRGGIGVYPTFVHVDTRGQNADW